jgi:hypothetical protein
MHRTVLNPAELPGSIANGDLLVGNGVQQRYDQLVKGAVGTFLRATATFLEWVPVSTILSALFGEFFTVDTATGIITEGGPIQVMVLVVPGTPTGLGISSVRIPAPVNGRILSIKSTARVAPSSTYTYDINIGGTTIYTTQGNRPTRTAAASTGVVTHTAPDVTTFVADDLFTVDVDTLGADASDVAFFIAFLRTS